MNKIQSRSLAATLLCAALLSPAFGAIRSVTPTAWANSPQKMQRHYAKLADVSNGAAKVVFIGDSITHYWETAGRFQVQNHFTDNGCKVLNLGTSGDRTENVLWRLDHGELDGYEAKCILLMIGTNNTGHFSREDEPPSDTILGVRAVLRKIREKQPKAVVVLTAIFPRGRSVSDPCRVRNAIVNKEIQKFCNGRQVFWCDFNDQFLTPDGLLPREYFPDRLHPASIGYEIWYSAVKPYIDYALSDGTLPCPANRYAAHVTQADVRMDELNTTYPVTRIQSEGFAKDDWWLDRLLRNRNQIADSNKSIDLVFFGDSITHNWDNAGKAQLEELRKTYSVLNIGYSGDRTQHLVWRGENGELDGYEAKCVMLMIGTNNGSDRDTPEEIAEGIRKVLGIIAAKQPKAKVLLLPIFPRGADATDRKRVKNEKVNAIIKDFADGERVVWVDFNSKLVDEKGDTQWVMPDRLHPNAQGYDIWVEAVRPYFERFCGKSAAAK